jgi:DNA ligase (NAD+)
MSHLKANFLAHEIIDKKFHTYKESMEYLKNLGFEVLNNKTCSTKEDCMSFFQESLNNRNDMPYPIDGVVFKINNSVIADSLGCHETAPRYAFAVKFDAIAKETTIRKIEVQVGKFGTLTPIAVFDTVLIDGHNIKKATIHNFDELNKNGYGVGDGILINRSGDVVPYISAKYYDAQNPFKIQFCPSCGSQVHEYQKTLVCNNKWDCRAQKICKIEHFCSKNAFNIEGIASSTIASFVESGLIERPVDIFALPEKIKSKQIFLGEGWKSKSIQNLINSIDQSREINLSNFLFALCIPNVGLGVSRKIAKNFLAFEDFYQNYTAEEPQKIDSIGEVIMTSIKDFLLAKDENWVFELKKIVKII